MSLVFENPIQTVLDLPANPDLWARSESTADAAARWRLYLYQLVTSALLQWCQEERVQFGNVQVWPEAAPLDIWHVVGGLALTLGDRRIVVILSEAMDAAEMRVPQEWIDLPDWAGDYYIAAYVDVDDQQLALWGYSTYTQVKNNGHYDAYERTYCLGEDHLIQDFSAFWVALQYESMDAVAVDAVAVDAVPALSPIQRNNLLNRLAQSVEPRLEIPFGLWGALLSDADARSQLYQKRCQKQQGYVSTNVPVPLSQWTQQLLSQGWERLESLLPQNPAASLRSASNSLTEDQPTPQSAVTGGKVIALRRHTEATASIEPTEPTETVELVLAIARTIEPDERRNIRIRLYPANQDAVTGPASNTAFEASRSAGEFPADETTTVESCLPNGITLALLLSDTEEMLQTVQAGEHDNYIQLPPFRCPAEQHFSVRIQKADMAVQEDFIS